MIDYQKILNKNMINVLKDILRNIENNGLSNNNHLYITFLTAFITSSEVVRASFSKLAA